MSERVIGWRQLDDSATEQSEHLLIGAALRGEREAWGQLIALHQREVFLSLLAKRVRVDRAKDLTQETWARLIAAQKRGVLKTLVLPHLAIAQARFLAQHDWRRHGDLQALPATLEELCDERATVEVQLLKREELRRAEQALKQCSPKSQQVFLIAHSNASPDHATVADKVGLSIQRVRQILCEVRSHLRKALRENDDA